MMKRATAGVALTAMVALSAAVAMAAPSGPRQPGWGAAAAPVEAQAQADPGITPEAENLPPPILPAPDLPVEDPLVELPPADAPATEMAGPGSPMTAGGQLFSFADLAERLLDSVVYISTSQRVTVPRRRPIPEAPGGDNFFDDFFDEDGGEGTRNVQSLGSGFVIDTSGLIVTNNHVIADADQIVANFADGRALTAEVVGIDEKTDLALLQVDAGEALDVAQFGRSERLRVGDWVLAIGNPFGFGGTVTLGIVSALDRDINSGPYDHYIQTDASINRGNSGGPLFNVDGEVVGVNTAIMSPTGGSIGIGFAVPSEIAVPVIEQLRLFGTVRRGWIGVRIQDVTDEVAEGLGMERAMGAFIAGLTEGGPAAEAGILDGDVVVAFNGEEVERMRALPQIVANTPPGDTVPVVVMRDGALVTLEIEVGLLEDEPVLASADPGDMADDDAVAMFGLRLSTITAESRDIWTLDEDVDGVLITHVEPGSEADEKSVKPGEVILQVSQTDVTRPEQVLRRFEELKAEGRRTVMLLLSDADNKLRFVSLRFEDE